jgi:1-acyl-sn-glycerol-3-phosphate acyltransferase
MDSSAGVGAGVGVRAARRGNLWLYDTARRVAGWLVHALRLRIIPTGLSDVPQGQVVLAVTHFGYGDFVPVALAWWADRHDRLRFLVGPRPYRSRLLGAAVTACGGVAVLGEADHASMSAAMRALDAGWSIALFPEAGVSRSFTVRRCHTGAVRMALATGVPLIPVGVWGGHRITTRGHGPRNRTHRGSVRDAWTAPVRVHFGPPVAFSDGEPPEQSARRLQRALQEAVDVAAGDFPLGRPRGAWWVAAKDGGGAPTEAERDIWDAFDASHGLRPDRDKM